MNRLYLKDFSVLWSVGASGDLFNDDVYQQSRDEECCLFSKVDVHSSDSRCFPTDRGSAHAKDWWWWRLPEIIYSWRLDVMCSQSRGNKMNYDYSKGPIAFSSLHLFRRMTVIQWKSELWRFLSNKIGWHFGVFLFDMPSSVLQPLSLVWLALDSGTVVPGKEKLSSNSSLMKHKWRIWGWVVLYCYICSCCRAASQGWGGKRRK